MMALFEVKCSGRDWQEDFTPLVPRLERLFRCYFRGWKDRDEIVENAVLLTMERFARMWRRGETIRLTTNFVVRSIRAGLRFMRRGNGGRHAVKSVHALSGRGEQLARVKARLDRLASWADYHLLLAELPEKDRQAVRMAVQGYRINEIARALRMDWRKVRSVLADALEALNA